MTALSPGPLDGGFSGSLAPLVPTEGPLATVLAYFPPVSRRSNSASIASRMNLARPYDPASASIRAIRSAGSRTCVAFMPSAGRPIRGAVGDTDKSGKVIKNDTVCVDAVKDAVYIYGIEYGNKHVTSNNAPICKWIAHHMNGTHSRHHLYVNGSETPFWVDVAHTHGHRTYGEKYGLWGSGMGPITSAGYRIAGCLGCGPKIAPLKHRAEQLAMESFA